MFVARKVNSGFCVVISRIFFGYFPYPQHKDQYPIFFRICFFPCPKFLGEDPQNLWGSVIQINSVERVTASSKSTCCQNAIRGKMVRPTYHFHR